MEKIEVVCPDMMCFLVDAKTLDATCCSYYEPAALNDPQGPQMSYGEWCRRRTETMFKEATHD